MEFSMDAVANKLILAILVLSAVMALIGFAVFAIFTGNADASVGAAMIIGVIDPYSATISDAIPFAAGIAMVTCLNVAKVFLMKRAVSNSVKRDAVAARLYLQGQYFGRLVLTAIVLFACGWLHTVTNEAGNPMYVNFMGAFFGILTFPIAMHSLRFFMRDALKDEEILEQPPEKSAVESAVDKLNAIGEEKDSASEEKDTNR